MSELRQRAATGLQVGDCFRIVRSFTQAETEQFAAITRDYNPVHFDAEYARLGRLDGVVCHGLLSASMVTEIGGQIGWLASGMNFRFKGPVYVGEPITCRWVIEAIDERGRASAEVEIVNAEGKTVVEAKIYGVIPNSAQQQALSRMLQAGDPDNHGSTAEFVK